jgi:PIN domain nuclease of toxin-antitoxin system
MSAVARAALVDPANERWLSPISLVEIALKVRLGKLGLPPRRENRTEKTGWLVSRVQKSSISSVWR